MFFNPKIIVLETWAGKNGSGAEICNYRCACRTCGASWTMTGHPDWNIRCFQCQESTSPASFFRRLREDFAAGEFKYVPNVDGTNHRVRDGYNNQ
jgi:hypothetical protein